MFSTKDHVISRLLRSGEYISGQSLSDELNISRAAVNAAVRSLKQDGYDISSVTNKGYRLNNRPDLLTAGSLLSLLPEARMRDVIILDKIDSTNKYLKSLASEGAPSGTVVISNCQTEGRGRLGRSFISPPDKGIYLLGRFHSIGISKDALVLYGFCFRLRIRDRVCLGTGP